MTDKVDLNDIKLDRKKNARANRDSMSTARGVVGAFASKEKQNPLCKLRS